MASYDDLNVGRITLVGVISVVVTAVTALAVQVVFYAMADWNDSAKQAASDYRRQNRALQKQADQISSFGVDADTGNVTIPVDQAMKLIVSDAGKSKSAAGKPKETDET